MTTHKEAVEIAIEAYDKTATHSYGIEDAIRAYIDARGLVMVPREPTEKELRDIAAAARDFMTEDGLYPRAQAMRKAMLAAAPDPFE